MQIDVIFVRQDASQNWGEDGKPVGGVTLFSPTHSPLRNIARVAWLGWRVLSGRYSSAHVAGWGHSVILVVWGCLLLRRVPFSVESDTQLVASGSGCWSAVKSILYPRFLRLPSYVLPGGTAQSRYFRTYKVPESRIRPAFMTVDICAIQSARTESRQDWRARHRIDDGDVVFLFVGRIERQKGLQYLLPAFEQLKQSHSGYRLVVLGDGSLTQEIQMTSSAVSAMMMGRQTFKQVIQWMRSSDVLVVPSLVEPWGLVVNEGMACGLPIIATSAVGAAEDLISEGVNGFVVRPGSASGLAEAMRKLAESTELRQRMGQASYAHIAPWTIERESTVVVSTIREMAGCP